MHLKKEIERRVESFLWDSGGSTALLDAYVGKIERDEETPYTASRKILDERGISA
jgi:hypothetical protein